MSIGTAKATYASRTDQRFGSPSAIASASKSGVRMATRRGSKGRVMDSAGGSREGAKTRRARAVPSRASRLRASHQTWRAAWHPWRLSCSKRQGAGGKGPQGHEAEEEPVDV